MKQRIFGGNVLAAIEYPTARNVINIPVSQFVTVMFHPRRVFSYVNKDTAYHYASHRRNSAMVSKQNPALCISKRGDAFIAARPKHIAANMMRIVFSIGFSFTNKTGAIPLGGIAPGEYTRERALFDWHHYNHFFTCMV